MSKKLTIYLLKRGSHNGNCKLCEFSKGANTPERQLKLVEVCKNCSRFCNT